MSGVAALLRRRERDKRRAIGHRTRQQRAAAMRGAALSLLRLPNLTDEAATEAHALLDLVGDELDLPRAGWYPRRPSGWQP